jgi:hypothetical protein
VLRIHLLEGQNLVPKDNMMGGMVKGKSDPYVKINIGGETFESRVINRNLNPTWNEMYEVGYYIVAMILFGRANKSNLVKSNLNFKSDIFNKTNKAIVPNGHSCHCRVIMSPRRSLHFSKQ